MYTKRKIIYSTITILWVAVIFGFSLQSADISSDISRSFLMEILAKLFPRIMESEALLDFAHVLVRKGAHFTEYFILGIMSTNAVRQFYIKHKSIISVLFCMLIACLDETLQLFVPGRDGRVLDVLIDSCGAITGIVIVMLIFELIKKYKKNIKKI